MENSINNFELSVNTNGVGACGVKVKLNGVELPKVVEIHEQKNPKRLTLTFIADNTSLIVNGKKVLSSISEITDTEDNNGNTN